MIGVAVGTVVLLMGGGITGIFAVELGVGVASLLWSLRLAHRALAELTHEPVPDPELRAAVLRYAGYSSAQVVIGLVVWRRSELLFLERTAAPAQVAMYSIAFAASTALTQAPRGAARASSSPALATLHGARRARAARAAGYGRAVRLTLGGSLVLAAFGLALGPAAVRLVYGEDYALAGQVLALMMLFFVFQSASVARLGGPRPRSGEIRLPLVVTGRRGRCSTWSRSALLIPAYGARGAASRTGSPASPRPCPCSSTPCAGWDRCAGTRARRSASPW